MENPTNLEFKKIFDNVAENFDEISSTYTRRTVSKYREQLKIPVARLRKEF